MQTLSSSTVRLGTCFARRVSSAEIIVNDQPRSLRTAKTWPIPSASSYPSPRNSQSPIQPLASQNQLETHHDHSSKPRSAPAPTSFTHPSGKESAQRPPILDPPHAVPTAKKWLIPSSSVILNLENSEQSVQLVASHGQDSVRKRNALKPQPTSIPESFVSAFLDGSQSNFARESLVVPSAQRGEKTAAAFPVTSKPTPSASAAMTEPITDLPRFVPTAKKWSIPLISSATAVRDDSRSNAVEEPHVLLPSSQRYTKTASAFPVALKPTPSASAENTDESKGRAHISDLPHFASMAKKWSIPPISTASAHLEESQLNSVEAACILVSQRDTNGSEQLAPITDLPRSVHTAKKWSIPSSQRDATTAAASKQTLSASTKESEQQAPITDLPRSVPTAKKWSIPPISTASPYQDESQSNEFRLLFPSSQRDAKSAAFPITSKPTFSASASESEPRAPITDLPRIMPKAKTWSIPPISTASANESVQRAPITDDPRLSVENGKRPNLSVAAEDADSYSLDSNAMSTMTSPVHSTTAINRLQPQSNVNHSREDKNSGHARLVLLNKMRLSGLQRMKWRTTKSGKKVIIPHTVTVSMLAKILNMKLAVLQTRMRRVGMIEEANYDHILTSDYAALLAEDFGFTPVVDNDSDAFDIYSPSRHSNPSSSPPRPPIVAIMGHVDHGKTTLLDTLRSSSVAKGEAGGITQHIGAFSVPVKSKEAESYSGPQSITFLDTPGHAAFSAMRARGANVTDIVVLVVAADDGVMPQTKEVIQLLNNDNNEVQLVVAINKIDKEDADPDIVKKALMTEGVQLEELGGDIPSVEVSGLTGYGMNELVEMLSAVSEYQDLRAEQDGPVQGYILESNFHKGLGPVATILVRRGCLKVGTHLICGLTDAKVRRMTDSNGIVVRRALPGAAVTVSGWKSLPKVGHEVLDGSDSDIKKALVNREKKANMKTVYQDAEAINVLRRNDRDSRFEIETPPTWDKEDNIGPARPKELKLIIKADVSGSGEAVQTALHGIGNEVAMSRVISTAVGDLTESDVMLAKAANATLLGFSVSAPRSIATLAAQNNVPLFVSNIIYRLVDDVRTRVISLLPTIKEKRVVGEATVLQLFDIQMKGQKFLKVAGCRVTNGVVDKQKLARLVRSGEIIYEGTLDTMRQLKKDITEARKGMECGLSFKDFFELREGDLIQIYETVEKPGIL